MTDMLEPPELPIEIIVGDGTPLTNAAVPVRWCIGKETLQKIKEKKGELRAMMLVVARDDKNRESRMIAPLSQGMGYLNLNRAGLNTIYCMIVYNPLIDKTNFLKKIFSSKDGPVWYSLTLEFENDTLTPYYNTTDYSYISGTQITQVDIPKELFGKELPLWLKNLVNTWQDPYLNDECARRGRLIFFILVKMWAMLITTVTIYLSLSMVVLFMTIIGHKPNKINFLWLKHPLTQWRCMEFQTRYHIMYNHALCRLDYRRIPLIPAISLVILTIFVAAGASILTALLWAVIATGLIPVIIFGLMLIGTSLEKIVDFGINHMLVFKKFKQLQSLMHNKLEDRQKQLIERDRAIAEERYNQSEDYLSCKLCDKVASVALVPRQNMTIRLRYEQIKNAVCKPMMK